MIKMFETDVVDVVNLVADNAFLDSYYYDSFENSIRYVDEDEVKEDPERYDLILKSNDEDDMLEASFYAIKVLLKYVSNNLDPELKIGEFERKEEFPEYLD